jgi:aryl-alcohol dehydrogenase-like predicted oxidoreductase
MKPCLSRRQFLAASAGFAAAQAGLANGLPPVHEFRRGGMVYRQLGRSDLYVSLLSFGSHTDPAYKVKAKHGRVLNEEGQQRRDHQLARAFDLGVNMVDTYENNGQWEPVARMVRPRRDKVLVSVCRQFQMFVGENIDRAAKLYGHVDLYRIYVGAGEKVRPKDLEDWDVMRKAKKAGKLRTLCISTHSEAIMMSAIEEFEDLDYIMFPYNFIHAKTDYTDLIPAARKKGVGLIAIKPLSAGSIVNLDPLGRPGTKPETHRMRLYRNEHRPLSPAVVNALTESLRRAPDETLCQAALRFVYSRPFMTAAMPGMFEDYMVDENYQALQRTLELNKQEHTTLDAAKRMAEAMGPDWLPRHYQWLDREWKA